MSLTLLERLGIRRVLVRTQGGICAICGYAFDVNAHWLDKDALPTSDHVIPMGRGGADRLGNLLATHGGCNWKKGGDMPSGCELIWLLAVNIRLGVKPDRW